VQSVFTWAVRYDLLTENPLVGYPKPAGRRRNRTVTDEEFRALLSVSDPAFAKVLRAMRLTGCRPAEIRSLIWEWVDLGVRSADRRRLFCGRWFGRFIERTSCPGIRPGPDSLNQGGLV